MNFIEMIEIGIVTGLLVGLTGIGHWKAVGALLCGSIPALWGVSQLHGRFSRQTPEGIIAAALMAMGVRIFL